jgi:hypothetical protein
MNLGVYMTSALLLSAESGWLRNEEDVTEWSAIAMCARGW